MFDTLRGVADRSPEQVAAGLNKMLKAYPKYMFDDPVMRLIDPHAHGLFQLCNEYSAVSTSAFDVRRGPPWDAEFHSWSKAQNDSMAGIDLAAIEPELHRVLVCLERPAWWAAEQSAAW